MFYKILSTSLLLVFFTTPSLYSYNQSPTSYKSHTLSYTALKQHKNEMTRQKKVVEYTLKLAIITITAVLAYLFYSKYSHSSHNVIRSPDTTEDQSDSISNENGDEEESSGNSENDVSSSSSEDSAEEDSDSISNENGDEEESSGNSENDVSSSSSEDSAEEDMVNTVNEETFYDDDVLSMDATQWDSYLLAKLHKQLPMNSNEIKPGRRVDLNLFKKQEGDSEETAKLQYSIRDMAMHATEEGMIAYIYGEGQYSNSHLFIWRIIKDTSCNIPYIKLVTFKKLSKSTTLKILSFEKNELWLATDKKIVKYSREWLTNAENDWTIQHPNFRDYYRVVTTHNVKGDLGLAEKERIHTVYMTTDYVYGLCDAYDSYGLDQANHNPRLFRYTKNSNESPIICNIDKISFPTTDVEYYCMHMIQPNLRNPDQVFVGLQAVSLFYNESAISSCFLYDLHSKSKIKTFEDNRYNTMLIINPQGDKVYYYDPSWERVKVENPFALVSDGDQKTFRAIRGLTFTTPYGFSKSGHYLFIAEKMVDNRRFWYNIRCYLLVDSNNQRSRSDYINILNITEELLGNFNSDIRRIQVSPSGKELIVVTPQYVLLYDMTKILTGARKLQPMSKKKLAHFFSRIIPSSVQFCSHPKQSILAVFSESIPQRVGELFLHHDFILT
ncbi:MAG: hypothetical protein AAF770_03320 [Bacteroidota bacterium]